jgi:hypothetical protein
MANAKKTSSAPTGMAKARDLAATIAKRHGVSLDEAARLTVKFLGRAKRCGFTAGWWLALLDAQFTARIGRYARIRCGDEVHLSHLIPEPGQLCHDCGCARGEYHVFGCDSEECSNCGGQAFCCDCDDDTSAEEAA